MRQQKMNENTEDDDQRILTKSSATIIIMWGFCAYWVYCALPQEIEQSRTHILRTSNLGWPRKGAMYSKREKKEKNQISLTRKLS